MNVVKRGYDEKQKRRHHMKQGGYKEIEKYEIGMKQTSQWDTIPYVS